MPASNPTSCPPPAIIPAEGEDEVFLEALLEVEQGMGVLIRRVQSVWKHSAATVHPELQPLGYKVLSAIVSRGQTQSAHLLEILSVDKSVLSRQLKALEEYGLIVVTPDPNDGRARLLTPTPIAIEKITAARRHNQQRFQDRLREWDPEEVQTFARLLTRLGSLPD